MSIYDRLKKIIPPDQALANQALSRSLRQIKRLQESDLPTIATMVSNMESNNGLGDINALTTPVDPAVSEFWENTFATGTGTGNTFTIADFVGVAAGMDITDQLPEITTVVSSLTNAGSLNSLIANTGNPLSVNNGIYTQMSYCIAEAYGNAFTGVVIPPTIYYAGGIFANIDVALTNGLIPAANSAINSITSINSVPVATSNAASGVIAIRVVSNMINLTAAGLNFGNMFGNDWTNSNVQPNQQSAGLGLGVQLHAFGLDISENGPAQFYAEVANMQSISGQAVVSSLREARNIAVFNAAGLGIDSQLSDINPNTPVVDNLSGTQSSAAQARANIII